ncbi:MAG: LLM class F420-dependent oxidoreductase [Anaerolineae bacterium]|nr:LLM class F420-dependent oxidoreductase [Anaerolineae bacterium]MCO5198692.1 LLM class F420-dependent oxidoreductase [Anaerolineae bacterium]
MKIGVIFPQIEFGTDPALIREYAVSAEKLGYSHILAYDHVLGVNPERPGNWQGPYTYEDPFWEPFVLFSYMAAVTHTIEFTTGIIIAPQRQTALLAKQAATLDAISGGRLRLGIGTGWNKPEYIALNQDFHTRGKRSEAQIDLMRKLWTQRLVTVKDEWHDIPDMGLLPMPVQRPIPIWLGGAADPVIRRVAKLADGWIPFFRRPQSAESYLAKLDGYLAEYGRNRADIGIEAIINFKDGNRRQWRDLIAQWEALGITHLVLHTMGIGLDSAEKHIAAIHEFAEAAIDS